MDKADSRAELAKILLVGEMNPYGADPDHALYCEPPHSAGGRLCRLVCQVHHRRYLAFRRVNLCESRWSMIAARKKAVEIRSWRDRPEVVVLLGKKVQEAFGFPAAWNQPFAIRLGNLVDPTYVLLPHPSGLCRVWNEPGAFEQARKFLGAAAPWVPWGETANDARVSSP